MRRDYLNKFFIFSNSSLVYSQKIFYSFTFISLITPFLISNVRFFSTPVFNKKILLKQSYILLTWFYYLSFLSINIKNTSVKHRINIFVLPLNRKKFTLTRAPMAHKTFSKEQYKFQFYKFKITFNAFLKETHVLNSLNNGLLFILLSKKFFPQFETNILFLKNCNIAFFVNDKNYFNYFKFLN
jgi:hypothetical protein